MVRLGLLGFYDELGRQVPQPNGSLSAAIRQIGEPDEVDIVRYLDHGHTLLDVMEGGTDVITGEPHRHSSGCASPVTDGTWLWRRDFAHYVEAWHVTLPPEFLNHVRRLDYQMPSLISSEFGPLYNASMPEIGWGSAVPWRAELEVIEPAPSEVETLEQFQARSSAGKRKQRYQG